MSNVGVEHAKVPLWLAKVSLYAALLIIGEQILLVLILGTLE